MRTTTGSTRSPLLILGMFLTLIVIGGSITTFGSARPRPNASPSVVVSCTFPSTDVRGLDSSLFVDYLLTTLASSFEDLPDMQSMAFARNQLNASIIVVFKPGTDPDTAVSNIQSGLQPAKRVLPELIMERETVVLHPPATSRFVHVTLECPDGGLDRTAVGKYCQHQLIPQLEQIRGLHNITTLGNEQLALVVNLDSDRMRLEKVSTDDVMHGMTASSMVPSPRIFQAAGSTKLVHIPVSNRGRADQYGDVILKANAEGEIVRVKDVGKVTLERLQHSHDDAYQIEGPPSAAIALRLLPTANTAAVTAEVRQKLSDLKRTSLLLGVTFKISNQLPIAWSIPRRGLPTRGR